MGDRVPGHMGDRMTLPKWPLHRRLVELGTCKKYSSEIIELVEGKRQILMSVNAKIVEYYISRLPSRRRRLAATKLSPFLPV
jgi:hypothetical protein